VAEDEEVVAEAAVAVPGGKLAAPCTASVSFVTRRRPSTYFCCSMKGGARVVIEPHRHPGVFIARGKEDALCTLNLNPGKQVYGEKLVKVDVRYARPSARSKRKSLLMRHLRTRTQMHPQTYLL
jgi:hypothetical protein